MKFGTKKKDFKEAEFNGNYLRSFKNGETLVRFLEEPDEWILYQEHFTRDRQSFPCTGNTNLCPGCTDDDEQVQRRSRKYGTHVYLIDANVVLPFKLAVTLANRLMARAERNDGTITNRDYVVIRSGEGLKTEYDVDQDEKTQRDVQRLLDQATDSIENILNDTFKQLWGDPAQYEDSPKARSKETSAPAARKSNTDDVPEGLLLKHEREAKDALDVFKPEEDEVTEAQIRAMNRGQLVDLWNKAGWEGFNEDWGKSELIDAILAKAD